MVWKGACNSQRVLQNVIPNEVRNLGFRPLAILLEPRSLALLGMTR